MRQSAKTNTIVVFSIAAIVIIGLVFYLTQRQPKAIIVPGECVELPEVDRDSCFLVLAGNNNDTSYCNSVSREDMRASCFNQSWITDSCRYSELIGTESCEVNAAIEAKNILLCESISNYGSYVYCRRILIDLAMNSSDVSICNDDPRCVIQVVSETEQQSYCQQVSSSNNAPCRNAILSTQDLLSNPYIPAGVIVERDIQRTESVNNFLLGTQYLRPSLCQTILSEDVVTYFEAVRRAYEQEVSHRGASYLYSRDILNLGVSAEDICFIQNAFSRQSFDICTAVKSNTSKILCQSNFIQVDCATLQNEQLISVCTALQNENREEYQSACQGLGENPLSVLCIMAKQ